MVWYGVVWHGVAWCGVTWRGLVWYEGERQMEWGEEMFALIDSLAGEDSTPEEPVEEEAPEIDDEGGAPKAMTHFSGFRQAYFEASQESNQREARRLGWSEYE